MQGQDKDRFIRLCQEASVEQNSQRLLMLVRQINEMLDKKQNRLNGGSNPPDGDPPQEK